MIFTQERLGKVSKYEIQMLARRGLLLYPRGASEMLLDDYLKKTEGLSLIQACLLIINALKVSQNDSHEVTITIPSKQLEAIAQLITYGNEKVYGSRILKDLLSHKRRKEIKSYGL